MDGSSFSIKRPSATGGYMMALHVMPFDAIKLSVMAIQWQRFHGEAMQMED